MDKSKPDEYRHATYFVFPMIKLIAVKATS